MNTRHERIRYKHLLLPIWSAAFRFRDRTFRFVVNGQSGKVRGERPYSPWKIALAVVTATAIGGGALWFLWKSGILEQAVYSGF